jgi:hypothetical protein
MLTKFLNCKSTEECLRLLLIIVLVIVIQMLLLKFFWNRALVPHVTVLKPIADLKTALMVALGINLVGALA